MIERSCLSKSSCAARVAAAQSKTAVERNIKRALILFYPRRSGVARKSHVAPLIRHVHVDHALRRPDPVVFLQARHFDVAVIADLGVPFDARKIDAPFITGGGAPHRRARREGGAPGVCRPPPPRGGEA